MAQKLHLFQAGRGLAAVAVVACHANTFAHRADIFWYGKFAVEFFFFLSGYIILYSQKDKNFRLGVFLLGRVGRIYPPFLPVAVISAGAYLWIHRPFDWGATLLLLPGRLALIPAWTLQHEMFFYCLVGLLMWRRVAIPGMTVWSALIVARAFVPTPFSDLEEVVFGPENLFFVAGAIACYAGFVGDMKVPAALRKLGDASYSIYLVHLPLLGALWRMGLNFEALVAAGIAGGIAYYHLVERPLLKLTHRLLRQTRVAPSAPYMPEPTMAAKGLRR